MSDIQGLTQYLLTHGKDDRDSWNDLSVKFNFKNGEAARAAWKKYRKVAQVTINKADKTEILPAVQQSAIQEVRENVDKGTKEIRFLHSTEALSEEEIWQETKMDKSRWEFTMVYQKKYGAGFLYTAQFRAIKQNGVENFQQEFIKFLCSYEAPECYYKMIDLGDKPKVAIILPKQDAHFNKFDVKGDNSIEKRFESVEQATDKIVNKVSATAYVEKIIYVVGSDQFNSEWTSLTTKGTPQSNILSYQDAFKAICDHEVRVIKNLTDKCQELDILFVPGNHDEFVGWHLIHWLETYFSNHLTIKFDSDLNNTKYLQYHNTAIMLNHGDDIKLQDLATSFPIGFKYRWSACSHYYIFTGDKHTEKSLDLNGIKIYQVPQLSSSTSKWDDKKGYIYSKAEMTAFVITQSNGMSDIIKEIL